MADRSNANASRSRNDGLTLLITGGGALRSVSLPASGTLTIGSAEDADVRVLEPGVADHHLRFLLEGTQQRVVALVDQPPVTHLGRALVPDVSEPIAAGDSLQVAGVTLILQRKPTQALRRIWTHGAFESRLEEQCIRAGRTLEEFGVLRVSCAPTLERTLEEVLANALRLSDVVGQYGPGELEAILCEADAAEAMLVKERLVTRLQERGVGARVALALFPGQGVSADALSSALSDQLREQPGGKGDFVVGRTLTNLETMLPRVAQSQVSVLLLGETGAGKERMAERIHALSTRGQGPFLRLNCAALSETLLESELFGHERGAFTGATAVKPGLLEVAAGGTVFLDEVGEMPLSIQAKLLRVLEDRQVMRLGALKPRSIDVRFVSATNRDLDQEVAAGRFREDLFYRFNGFTLSIPPLRERLDELEPLAHHFLSRMASNLPQQKVPELSRDAIEVMRGYHWPGNIRELRNLMERAALLAESGVIRPEHLPMDKMASSFAQRHVRAPPAPFASPRPTASAPDTRARAFQPPPAPEVPPPPEAPRARGLKGEVMEFERTRIIEALAASHGNQKVAADRLGISRRTLINRLESLGISGPRKHRGDER